MSATEVDTLINLLKSFPRPKEAVQRKRLWEAVRSFLVEIEDEDTTQHRILGAPLQLIIPRLASDMNLFQIIIESDRSLSLVELSSRCRANQKFLGHIVRYLTSQHLISESESGELSPSSLTPILANPAYASGLRFAHEVILPATLALPKHFAALNYSPIALSSSLEKDDARAPFQTGHGTDLPAFTWLATRPHLEQDFNAMMAETHKGLDSEAWDYFDLEEHVRKSKSRYTESFSRENFLFVDIGGGNGRSCRMLRDKFPNIMCRFVNQDRDPVIRSARADAENMNRGIDEEDETRSKIEHMVYDFFDEQPILGADIYYLRRVLHNWPDQDCTKILRRVCQAMMENSIIIIDEIVVTDTRANWHMAYVDVTMLAMFGAGCRTRSEFNELCKTAGLIVVEELNYLVESGETILVVKKA